MRTVPKLIGDPQHFYSLLPLFSDNEKLAVHRYIGIESYLLYWMPFGKFALRGPSSLRQDACLLLCNSHQYLHKKDIQGTLLKIVTLYL